MTVRFKCQSEYQRSYGAHRSRSVSPQRCTPLAGLPSDQMVLTREPRLQRRRKLGPGGPGGPVGPVGPARSCSSLLCPAEVQNSEVHTASRSRSADTKEPKPPTPPETPTGPRPAADLRPPEPEPGPGPAAASRPASSMQCTRCPAVVVLMALVLCGVSSQPDRDQDQFQNQDLDLELRHHRLLQKARSAGLLSQEWSKRAVEDLLAQMSLPEPESQREAEVVSMATGGRMNLERSVDPQNNIPPRDRKAGCKNFYWKGFTSC